MWFRCTFPLILCVQVLSAPQNGNGNIPDISKGIKDYPPSIEEVINPITQPPLERKQVDPLVIIANIPSSPINVSDSAKPCTSCGKGPLLACPKDDGECGSGEACCYDSCRARQVCRPKTEIVGYKEPERGRFRKREAPVTGDNITEGKSPVTGDSITEGEALVTGDNITEGEAPVTEDSITEGEALVTGDNITEGEAPVTGDNMTEGEAPMIGDKITEGETPIIGDKITGGEETISGRQNVDVPIPLDEEYGPFGVNQGGLSRPESLNRDQESLSVFASTGDRAGEPVQQPGANLYNQFQQYPFDQSDDFEEELPFVFNQAPQAVIPVQQPIIIPAQYIPDDNEDEDEEDGGFFESLFG